MISRLQGTVVEVDPGRLVVSVGGVGYDVQVPDSVISEFGTVGLAVDLSIRTLVREDDISLFGFSNRVQRQLFDLLRGVQGCGAKTSLSLIGTLGEQAVRDAVLAHDVRTLVKAPGVGPKLAEKMVATLRDRMVEVVVGSSGVKPAPRAAVGVVEDDLLDACMTLGYQRNRVEPLLEEAREQGENLEAQIRFILKRLAR